MATRTEAPRSWEIEEDDFGDLMVSHAHAGRRVPAYVIGRWVGGTVAQCSDCLAYVELGEEAPRHRATVS